MPKDFSYENLLEFWLLDWISKINGEKERAACLDNSVDVKKDVFNNIIRLRRDGLPTGFGEKDKFVESTPAFLEKLSEKIILTGN